MTTLKTVVLGEASDESDCEDIDLENERPTIITTASKQQQQQQQARAAYTIQSDNRTKGGLFGSSLFASIGSSSSSTLAKLAKYSPYDLLGSTLGQASPATSVSRNDRTQGTTSNFTASSSIVDSQLSKPLEPPQLPPLHRTLYVKNHQFHASMNHLYKHPLLAASKGMHTISQRLVYNQKVIQEINDAMAKIQREQRNIDLEIPVIM